jgi:ketosteroid isomerase-like protein
LERTAPALARARAKPGRAGIEDIAALPAPAESRMKKLLLFLLAATCTAAAAHAAGQAAASAAAGPRAAALASIDAFNAALADATRQLDSAATLRLWEEDGTTLLPDTEPIVGKRAIARFLDDALRPLAGAHMAAFQMHCAGVELAGDWASEWCTEHQKVELAGGKPPFEGWGKMLLVLHRGGDGSWRLRREMWNSAQPPAAGATARK